MFMDYKLFITITVLKAQFAHIGIHRRARNVILDLRPQTGMAPPSRAMLTLTISRPYFGAAIRAAYPR